LVIDGDDPVLKAGFSTVVYNELSQGLCAQAIKRTTDALVQQGYHRQVHPRQINLFYCQDGLRERLIKDSDGFSVDQTALKFSQDELLKLVESEPQNFSPNALLRPLYQESILPNLAYLGGSAEVAYWLQLGECFKACQVTFPMVYLRNSVALFPEKAMRKVESMNMTLSNLFLKEQDLSRQCVGSNSNLPIDFGPQKKHLKQQFADLYDLASRTDPSFLGAVAAQEKKQLKGLDRLEQRLMRAEKRKNADLIQRLLKQREYLFPEGILQERKENMSWGFFELGLDFLALLKKHIDPSDQRFLTLIFKS
jgi:bacillithiol biosynthesis cysteine-adding enzyme BshC